MTALVLHTALTVVLIGWAYMVTSRIAYRPAWIWSGTALVVLVGYVSLLARSVFEGSPARVQAIVGNVGATLMVLSSVVCLALFAAVSRGPQVPVAAGGASRAYVSGWAPRDEESVIVPDDSEDWDSGSVIDSGTWPSGPSADDEPRGGRYAYASADEADDPPSTPARSADGPVAPFAAPPAAPVVARPTPRRALPSPTDMGE